MHGNGSASQVQFGPVTLIADERLVLKDGRPVPFTPKGFDLLVVLTASSGRLLTNEQLMQVIWPDAIVEEFQSRRSRRSVDSRFPIPDKCHASSKPV